MSLPAPSARLNLLFTQEARTRMLAVQRRTDAASITEVIRRAVALYDVVTQLQGDGATLHAHYADGQTQPILVL